MELAKTSDAAKNNCKCVFISQGICDWNVK